MRNAFKAEVKKRGLGPLVRANSAGCLEQCEHGPCVAIYPQAIFYGGVQLADVSRILDETIISGRVLEDLLIANECLNNPNCEHIQARKGQQPEIRSQQSGASSQGAGNGEC